MNFKRKQCSVHKGRSSHFKNPKLLHSDELPLKCDICDYRTQFRCNLKKHVLIHSNKRPFKCDICDYCTQANWQLKLHLMTHTDERPFKCDICEYGARTRHKLKIHAATHTDERPFKCHICDYRARRRDFLKRHVTTHSDKRQFQCYICQYRTRRQVDLKKHVETHSDERSFQCHICQYRARRRDALKDHVLTHSDERPFQCHICQYRTRRRGDLKKHAKTHSDERPFQCHICQYRTRRRGDLKNHVAAHSDERPFKCSFCDFAAKLKQGLRAHIARLHPSKSGIERKTKKSIASKRKNKYKQTKFGKCRFCGNVFNRSEALISHENICRSSKIERISTKANAKKPNQANMESKLSDSNEVQSEKRSTDVIDFVFPLKLKPDDNRGSSQAERSVPNMNDVSRNELDQSKEVEIHFDSDPDEPRHATQSNASHSEPLGCNFNRGIAMSTWPSECELNTVCPTLTSVEIKKEPELLSNDSFSSKLPLSCVKFKNEGTTLRPAINGAIYGPDSEASGLELSVMFKEPIDHLKNEFGFDNNDIVDHENQFTNKRCSIILTKLEDLGDYHGCYYIRVKEAPYLYEAVKVNLNSVI